MSEKCIAEIDYKNALKLLLRNGREQGVNVKSCNWVLPLTKTLSEMFVAEKFWSNTISQLRLHKIFSCRRIHDLCYAERTCLFAWDKTEEGREFWYTIFTNLYNKYPKNFSYYGWL